MSLITVKNVKKNYRQGSIITPALRDVSFDIKQGEFAALVGPSGSGKTTLLNLIGALDKPTEGEIILNDVQVKTLGKAQATTFRLNHIGFVFQFYNLIPVFTALENVEYPLMLKGIPKKIRREKATLLLYEMGLKGLLNRFPKDISGGQQQRVAVARALISAPKVVLADEPTANLDSESADILLDIMHKMCYEKNITFLFSTHDERVMKKAERLIILHDGQLSHIKKKEIS